MEHSTSNCYYSMFWANLINMRFKCNQLSLTHATLMPIFVTHGTVYNESFYSHSPSLPALPEPHCYSHSEHRRLKCHPGGPAIFSVSKALPTATADCPPRPLLSLLMRNSRSQSHVTANLGCSERASISKMMQLHAHSLIQLTF